MIRPIDKLVRDERGATAVEYGLIVALILVVAVAALTAVNARRGSLWADFTGKIASALPFEN